MTPRPPAERGTCRHCNKPVIVGRLQNGRYRTFQPEPVSPAGPYAPGDTYAFSRGLRAFVDMVGVAEPPREVLAAHFCQEYRDAKLLAGVDAVGSLTEAVAPTAPRGRR